jgi:four helix bundle protein
MPSPVRDLAERTFEFAKAVRHFTGRLPRALPSFEDGRQLLRASGSVAANYLESQEGLSRKDFFFRIRVCRKEARECVLWLRLLEVPSADLVTARAGLVDEAIQLTRIFSSIARKDDSSSST